MVAGIMLLDSGAGKKCQGNGDKGILEEGMKSSQLSKRGEWEARSLQNDLHNVGR